jgi:CheY-like chemotaxis protein
MMPVLDGFGFLAAKTRRAWLARVPVVLHSAEARLPKTAFELGVAGCLEKPATVDALLQVVGDFTRSAWPPAPGPCHAGERDRGANDDEPACA